MINFKPMETIVTKGEVLPIMHQHNLTCIKSTKQFTEGETIKCYVAKYSNNRFAVWDCSWLHHNKYEVFNESELHDIFNES